MIKVKLEDVNIILKRYVRCPVVDKLLETMPKSDLENIRYIIERSENAGLTYEVITTAIDYYNNTILNKEKDTLSLNRAFYFSAYDWDIVYY